MESELKSQFAKVNDSKSKFAKVNDSKSQFAKVNDSKSQFAKVNDSKSKLWKYLPVARENNVARVVTDTRTDELSPVKHFTKIKCYKGDSLRQLIDNEDQQPFNDIVQFLKTNYKNNAKSRFPLRYTVDTLRWFFSDKENDNNGNVLVLVFSKSGETILGAIASRGCRVRYCSSVADTIGVSFLCVKSDLRKMGVASILIDRLIAETKNCNKMAVFMSSQQLPIKPLKRVTYMHLPLSPRQLHQKEFISIESKRKYSQMRFDSTQCRLSTDADLEQMYDRYKSMSSTKDLTLQFDSLKSFANYFRNSKSMITLCVNLKSDSDSKLHFGSFIPISLGSVRNVYVVYCTCDIDRFANFLKQLKYEVISATSNQIGNSDIWIEGTGVSSYYLYNQNREPIDSNIDIYLSLIHI